MQFLGGTRTEKQLPPKSTTKPANTFRAPQSRKRKIVPNESNITAINAAIDKLDKVAVQGNKTNIEDEFDIFGKFIAIQLRQMPVDAALMCQESIQTVIRQKRLQMLSIQPSQQPFSNDYDEEDNSSSYSNNTITMEHQQYSEDSQETSDDILCRALTDILPVEPESQCLKEL